MHNPKVKMLKLISYACLMITPFYKSYFLIFCVQLLCCKKACQVVEQERKTFFSYKNCNMGCLIVWPSSLAETLYLAHVVSNVHKTSLKQPIPFRSEISGKNCTFPFVRLELLRKWCLQKFFIAMGLSLRYQGMMWGYGQTHRLSFDKAQTQRKWCLQQFFYCY
jgi:hypothetical protein